MPRPARRERGLALFAALTGLLLLGGSVAVPAASGSYAVLPVESGTELLGALALPAAAPGGASTLGYALTDPFAPPITNLSLTFDLYAFNPTPGTGVTPLPPGAPSLTAGGSSGPSVRLSLLQVVSGEEWYRPVNVSVPASAPLGTYVIRDSLNFTLNDTRYLFESRGYFSTAAWENATRLPNGTPTLNLSRLGVSGVLPETALLVQQNAPIQFVLYGLLGGALVLAALGAYVAGKRPTGSSAGASGPPREKAAPTALGNRRTSDGD